jgi:hypothetical protein
MAYDEKTKLTQILSEHPWLEEELPRRYPQLKKMDNPAARFMLKRMTVKDAAKLSGHPAEKLLGKLERVIAEHEGQA